MLDRLQYIGQLLMRNPVQLVLYLLYMAATILISLILHEVGHAYVALRCGDPTAKWLGRVSLDPRKHLDPIGTICLFLLGFGWAKPVPVNPRNFKHGVRDDFLVSIAGIVVNLSLFLVCSLASIGVNELLFSGHLADLLAGLGGSYAGLVNLYDTTATSGISYAIYSGNHYAYLSNLTDHAWLLYIQRFLLMMGQINLSLAVFNLLPIPPLDGYHVVNDLLLKGRLNLNRQLFQIAQIAMLVLMFSGALGQLLTAINSQVYSAVIHLFCLIIGRA